MFKQSTNLYSKRKKVDTCDAGEKTIVYGGVTLPGWFCAAHVTVQHKVHPRALILFDCINDK